MYKNLILSGLCLFSLTASAQDQWLNIYYPGGTKFNQYELKEKNVEFDETASELRVEGETEAIKLTAIECFKISANTPRIDITDVKDANGNEITEITSKVDYLKGNFSFSGMGLYDDLDGVTVSIRGRGNSTWDYAKKPYRLKFDKKQKVGNMRKCKSLCLLANWIDPAMMRNISTFAFGQIIGMPYINNVLPVDLYLNNIYKGSYLLTEKVGISSGSVDLSSDDEANSIMFEMDMYPADADEYPAVDPSFGFQHLVKDPDVPADEAERNAWLAEWRADFTDFTQTVKTRNAADIYEKCDLPTLVKFIMVNNLACNQELDHPKSIKLWKVRGGKYNFGPCWDFDWCYGYSPTANQNPSATWKNPLLVWGSGDYGGVGANFFISLIQNDTFKAEFAKAWRDFYDNHLDEFWEQFDYYVDLMEPSANHQSTKTDFNGYPYTYYRYYRVNVENLRSWIKNRIEFINSDADFGLY